MSKKKLTYNQYYTLNTGKAVVLSPSAHIKQNMHNADKNQHRLSNLKSRTFNFGWCCLESSTSSVIMHARTYHIIILQDYVSTWQIRDALQRNRIVPTFVLQFDGRFGPPSRSLTEAYQSLRAGLTTISAQVLTIDSRNATSVTRDLITVIQTAYNVSKE